MDRVSSDDEEDQRNLIDQNDTKPSPPRSAASAFSINNLRHPLEFSGPTTTSSARQFHFQFNKRYLFAIFLPLFILILYFSIDLRNIFRDTTGTLWPLKLDSSPSASRMRESELQALSLLRHQRLGLLSLWNSSSPTNSTSLEDFRSLLLEQIQLNQQIQQVLLSSHPAPAGSNSSSDDNDDLFEPTLGLGDICRKRDQKMSQRRTIEWKPKPNKYLFAICVSGQMSNHLICLEKHMFFAALLDRILVIPSPKVDYQYGKVLDVDHVNQCLGRKVVVTFDEFAEAKKNHLHIDRFICYFSLPQPCYVDDEHLKKMKSSLGISMGKLERAWVEDIKKPSRRTGEDVMAKFSTGDDVIAIGDVFYANVEPEWVMQPGGPLAHKCKTLVEPSRFILLTAQRFIQTFLGKNFIALHFRRHGFLKFCNTKQPSCFFPVPQAADCINHVVERANMAVIYISTDAAESETSLLQSLIVRNGKPVPLVKRPARNSVEKWDALLYRHGLQDDSQVEAMLDKTICAMSSIFIGSSGSTFTEDILRLRKDWESASVCDEYLCQGEQPSIIADDK
ncbi:GDP-fucose protein O-fucosyltransferase [Dillenia turbinata]|uniref:GDP-fucose protein O-fucosyltransferase 2 n=1 Tax=Dillenia turbinata TaxID=194707 RepID=A0AAN8UMP7_9MAGN